MQTMAQWRMNTKNLAVFLLFLNISSVTMATNLYLDDTFINQSANLSFDPGHKGRNINIDNKISISNGSCNRTYFLEQYLGPRTKNLTFTVVMGSIYSIILITGIFGNISTCLVILYNSCMHTTTNYYIFSLAVSDVLFLIIGLPIELHGLIIGSYPWAFGTTVCILRTFIFEATTICSILTILTFTFERWLHICKSIYAKKFSDSFSRAIKIIILIWVLSCTSALPFIFTTGVFHAIGDYEESLLCGVLPKYGQFMNTIIKLSLLLFFVLPMTLISIMYILIGIKLWKSQKSLKVKPPSTEKFGLASKLKGIINNSQSNSDNHVSVLSVNLEVHRQNIDRKFDSKNINKFLTVDQSDSLNENSLHQDKGFNRRTTYSKQISDELRGVSKKVGQSRRDVVKMLFVVVIGFFVCWAPFHLQRIWTTMTNNISNPELYELLYYVSGISIYISSTINPLLYNLMSERYRTAFKNTFQMLIHCRSPDKANKQKYHGSHLYYYNIQNMQRFKNKAQSNSINNNNNNNNKINISPVSDQNITNINKSSTNNISTKSKRVCIVSADSIRRVEI